MKKTFKLEDVDCPNCAAKLERAISGIEGVKKASVSFIAAKMIIKFCLLLEFPLLFNFLIISILLSHSSKLHNVFLGGFGNIQHAAGAGEQIGIGLLIESVGGNGERSALADGVQRLHTEVILAQIAHDAVAAAAGGGADSGTFQDLAHVQSQCLVISQTDGRGGKGGGVIAAAAQNHLRAGFQRF